MTDIILSYEAKQDLKNIKKYITAELDNPTAAENTLKKSSSCKISR